MNLQDSWMYEDGQDEVRLDCGVAGSSLPPACPAPSLPLLILLFSTHQVVFTVDRPCQLLGAGLCGTEGAFTVELELVEVRAA